ncbi:MAG: DUF4202 domain-containing protein [Chitinophagaceae bacterium]
MNRLEKAFDLFDSFNKQDPHQVNWNGVDYAAEYFYALQLYHWVLKLEPGAGEDLLLASRSQHIGRWKIPRNEYPAGKAGYLRWRTDLKKFHAEVAGKLLSEAGYEQQTIGSVQHIILKEGIKTDHQVQVMENALCLVFLQFQYADFISNHDDSKVIRIIQKSWTKMSTPGREAALNLNYAERGKVLIEKALAK